jgi:hypothetical protein
MPKLFMLLIGCTPPGRHIEQHDIYFGIGDHISDLVPDLIKFWPEAKGDIHIDAWREVRFVNGFVITVFEGEPVENTHKLFFINLGGYKQNEFEEFHYKMIVAATDKGEAVKMSKQTAFYKHTGFKGANSHIDDKYGIDVDDIYSISDILRTSSKRKYSIAIQPANGESKEDEIRLGYFKIDNVEAGFSE